MEKELKISICIPQYNRIAFLLKSLYIIEKQTYNNIEICISDDCSSDNTEEEILALIPKYRYPIIFDKNKVNLGFDRNLRKSIEMSSGDYALVIGNDDTINGNESIEFLTEFLVNNNLPDIGYCNLLEERTNNTIIKRAQTTKILGTGPSVVMKYYSCFSFVGGLIYKKSTFMKFNTDKMDGSIYCQIYLGCLMIAKGCTLFSIKEPLVVKDILLDGKFRHSYRDRIAKKWKDFKLVDSGLPSVMNVIIESFKDADIINQSLVYKVFKKIYSATYPFWIVDYKSNNAFPEACGLILGLFPPKVKNYNLLSTTNKLRIIIIYFIYSIGGLLMPVFIFKKITNWLYIRQKQKG